jgi:hypothetical protein
MRFGTFVPQGWKGDQNGIPVEEQWERITGFANLIEDSGYDSIWVYDHFHTHPVVSQESTFDAWTLMAALAAVTTRARLGQMCPVPTPVAAGQDGGKHRRHLRRASRRRDRGRVV